MAQTTKRTKAAPKRPKRPKKSTSSEVAFALDPVRLKQIQACLKKGELRLNLKDAKVSITDQGVLLDAYAWD